MKREKFSTAVGNIDDRHVQEMLRFEGKRKNSVWIKWGSIAASFVLLTVIAVMIAMQLMPKEIPSVTDDGSFRRDYKGNINTSEMAIIWPWEYMTVTERYYSLRIEGIEYYASMQTVDAEQLGEWIGSFEAVGYDYYEENKKYRQSFDVFAVQNVPQNSYVAVKAEGEYHIYATNEGRGQLAVPEIRYLAGRVIEICDGYVIIDDTELCTDPEEGMSFKILTDDFRVSRCFRFEGCGIEIGSIVLFSFDAPITLGEGNTVDGAIDVHVGYLLENGDVLIPE